MPSGFVKHRGSGPDDYFMSKLLHFTSLFDEIRVETMCVSQRIITGETRGGGEMLLGIHAVTVQREPQIAEDWLFVFTTTREISQSLVTQRQCLASVKTVTM